MHYFNQLFLILLTLVFLNSCEPLEEQPDDNIQEISWQGLDSLPPEDPELNWFYYDVKEKKTLIWNGLEWETMTVSGIDGTSIKWLGSYPEAPVPPTLNGAYFNTVDSVSYIFTGEDNLWDTLSCSGKDGLSIEWQGRLPEAPEPAKYNWTYYNTVDSVTYIFNGTWDTLSVDGINGIDLSWQGTFAEHPPAPMENWAYYNSDDKMSYIYTDGEWLIICKDGLQGEEGISIIWQGELPNDPENPEPMWAYFNTTNGNSYIYSKELGWSMLARAGKDGVSIKWLGSFDDHPADATLNNAYFNTADGNSYIHNGTDWELLCKSGENGTNGTNGVNGVSINWRGPFTKEPSSANLNDAYYNSTDKNSYIFDGEDWRIFAKSGKDGTSLNWLGSKTSEPYPANKFDAYYHMYNGVSYIYTGSKWDTLSIDGKDGADGISLTWIGDQPYPPTNPKLNWIYHDSDDGITYIWDGYEWDIFCKDGKNGKDAEDKGAAISGFVAHGDSLILVHNLNNDFPSVTAMYITADSVYHPYKDINPNWSVSYDFDQDIPFYTSLKADQKRDLLKLKNGSLLHIFIEEEGLFTGGKYMTISPDGTKGETKLFSKNNVKNISVAERTDGTLIFCYIDITDGNKAKVTYVSADGTKNDVVISNTVTKYISMIAPDDNTLFFAYVDSNDKGCYRRFTKEGTFSSEQVYCAAVPSNTLKNNLLLLQDKSILLTYMEYEGKAVVIDEANVMGTPASFGNAGILDLGKAQQASDGSIFTLSYSTPGSSDNTLCEITKLTSAGALVFTENVASHVSSAQMAVLADNSPAIVYVREQVGSEKGHAYLSLFNSELEHTFVNRLNEKIFNPEMVLLDDGRLAMTYADVANKSNVWFSTLLRSELEPEILVKRIDANSCCMINNTGRTLEMMLSVYLGRGDNDAVVHLHP